MSNLPEKWLPQTQIVFADTGIDDTCKPYFTSNAALITWIKTKIVPGTTNITDYSFQRNIDGMPIRVDHSDAEYQALMQCDTVAWINPQQVYQPRWMVAHITGIEWKNPNCSFVYYEIDWYTSFVDCISWPNSICMIEREHVKKDWEGTNPLLYQCGVDEGFNIEPSRIIGADQWNPYTGGYEYAVVSPYTWQDMNSAGPPRNNYEDDTGLKRYVGLQFVKVQNKTYVDAILTAVANNQYLDINQIVDIITIPSGSSFQQSKSINAPWSADAKFNNAKCWSGEFNFFRMWVPMADKPVNFSPEYVSGNYSTFNVQCLANIKADTALIQYTPVSTKEPIPFLNADMSAFISELPMGAWTADLYAQWKSLNAFPLLAGVGLNAVSAYYGWKAADAASSVAFDRARTHKNRAAMNAAQARSDANTVESVVGEINDVISAYQKWATARQNGASVKGTGNLGVNQTFEVYGFMCYLLFYQAEENDMKAVDNFFDRFGYKVNALRAPDPTNRPKWYYLKTVDAHVTDKGGLVTMGSTARRAIEALFNTGVTIFRTDLGIDVGDFSEPEGNKAT